MLVYNETPEGWWRLYTENPGPHVASAAALLAAGGCGVCSLSSYTLADGGHADIYACTLHPPNRRALATANPPSPQRRLARAVLEHYIRRMLAGGSSLWRLAALLAGRAGGVAALLAALINQPGAPPRPHLYLAAAPEAGVCTLHTGRSATLATPLGAVEGRLPCRGWETLGVVLHARPAGGLTVALQARSLEDALKG